MKAFLAPVIFLNVFGVACAHGQSAQPHQTRLATERTKITCTLGERMPYNRNMLWCASFQIAWDTAAANLGGPIELNPASKVTEALNNNPFDRNWINEASVMIEAGTVKDGVLTKIEGVLTEKNEAGGKILETIRNSSPNGDMVFFAKLKKRLDFEHPFKILGVREFEKRKVPMFGFASWHEDIDPLLNQVLVHHYRAEDDFVIEILSKTTDDQLLLARLPDVPDTLTNVSQNLIGKLQVKAPNALTGDQLAVPNILIGKTTRFPQIEGRMIAGKELLVRLAIQSIDFQLDETGAKVRSDAAIQLGFGADDKPPPRRMTIVPPFALIMKRKDATQPYFVAWFANADLLGAP